jgi:hypothetical protein
VEWVAGVGRLLAGSCGEQTLAPADFLFADYSGVPQQSDHMKSKKSSVHIGVTVPPN